MQLTTGQIVGERYQVIGPLGSGGMGKVYRVQHTHTSRIEALKLVDLEGLRKKSDLTTDEMIKRFQREIRVHGSLDHENVAKLFDAFPIEDRFALVMEFIAGLTIGERLKNGPQFSIRDAVDLACQALDALAHAHGRGVTHRDITPSNLMVTNEGQLKVMDFGIAISVADERLTRPGIGFGKPNYVSPEQQRGWTDVDHRSDIYSLAITLYEMLTHGKYPFQTAGKESVFESKLRDDPVPPSRENRELPQALDIVILKALKCDRDRRFSSAEDFREALRGAVVTNKAEDQTTQLEPLLKRPARPRLEMPGPRPALLQPGEVRINPIDGLEYVRIPAGTFQMGAILGDTEASSDESPLHTVTISRGFWMGRTPVTVEAYERFLAVTKAEMPPAPSFNPDWLDKDHPIVNVSWEDAEWFCEWAGSSLPTEAQWEYAARGGKEGFKYPWGNDITHNRANYEGTGGRDRWKYTSPVGSFDPNGFGLFDVVGNVWEWVADWYQSDYYAVSPGADPNGPDSGDRKALRGGSWNVYPRSLRVSVRVRFVPGNGNNSLGFRCLRESSSL